jgi:hypothetical protein
MWNTLRRWRTWIFNGGTGVFIVLPELVAAFSGYDWSGIVPSGWAPVVTAVVLAVNVLMRPRPAVLPSDSEARASRAARDRGW